MNQELRVAISHDVASEFLARVCSNTRRSNRERGPCFWSNTFWSQREGGLRH